MIKANHKKWAKILFDYYIYKQFKKNFHSFNLIGERPKPCIKPILLLSNHSSWWDGFFTYFWNNETFKKKYHIMMLEEQLKKYYFFGFLGAFSIKQESPKQIIESLEYSRDLLKSNDNLVNIYPEGKMDFAFKNKVNFKPGILRITKNLNSDVQIYLLAMKIHHLHQEKPQVFFQFENISFNDLVISDLELKMNQMLNNIDSNLENAEVVFEGKISK